MNKKIGLGKGLGALLPASEEAPSGGLIEAQVRAIAPNPHQPRMQFDEQTLRELANSIREHGLIQPLVVKRTGDDQFTLIAGERRWRAAILAGLETVPVVVKDVAPQQMLEMALVENVQRSDLNALEEAQAYKHLSEEFGLTQDQIAQRVGKSRVAVANTLRLLKLPDSVKNALIEQRITEGHARALLALPTPEAQAVALRTVIAQELNVRQTEELVRKLCGERPPSRPKATASPEVVALEERLRSSLGTKVILREGRKGGTMTIHFYSNEELDSLLALLLKEQ